jgi:RNA polymerase sigma factor (sigma-70 family)
MAETDWTSILEGIRYGDSDAWLDFWEHFHRPMRAIIARQFPRLQVAEEARDVVAEALLQIIHTVRRGANIVPARLPGYVLTACRRQAIHELRHICRLESIESLPPKLKLISPEPSIESKLLSVDPLERLQKTIRRLRPSDRNLLLGLYEREESFKTLAQRDGTTVGNIRQRKRRALARLTDALNGWAA